MKLKWILILFACSLLLALMQVVEAAESWKWTRPRDLVIRQIDQQPDRVVEWLERNITASQSSSFEATLFPALTKEEELAAAQRELEAAAARGKDVTVLQTEVETLKNEIEEAERQRQEELDKSAGIEPAR